MQVFLDAAWFLCTLPFSFDSSSLGVVLIRDSCIVVVQDNPLPVQSSEADESWHLERRTVGAISTSIFGHHMPGAPQPPTIRSPSTSNAFSCYTFDTA